MSKHIIISKSVLGVIANLDPSVAAVLEQAGAKFDMELAEQDPSAAVAAAKQSIRDLPKVCDLCASTLEIVVDGRTMRFTQHTDEFCRASTRRRILSLVSNMQREVLDHARMRRALGDMYVEMQDHVESYARAQLALERAGVPNDVGNKDELDNLAARIRWLVRREVDGDANVLARLNRLAEMFGEKRESGDVNAEFDRIEGFIRGRLQ